ncbi:P-loop containing nucleoside triphosphate hydrolase [Colletotrichum musicola]|uniref:P-loop containing nucleoside triphosphate hydrolase n=1 Tax=Colletotrichum musicola TaxID=2175873 RepID=A0A8H6NF94_9PEZI|nr:P-loop containing nucleoside triphosphate hydrolase [Colletotrichum musicola]
MKVETLTAVANSSSNTKLQVESKSQTKLLLENHELWLPDYLLRHLEISMLHARSVKQENVSHMIEILDNLDEAVRSVFFEGNGIYPMLYNVRLSASLLGGMEASSTSANARLWWPLLQDAAFCHPPELAIVNYLLELGADVNFPLSKHATVWTELLADMVNSIFTFSGEEETRWKPWPPVYIERGADVKGKVFRVAVNASSCPIGAEQLRRTIMCIKNGDDDAARKPFMAEVQSRDRSQLSAYNRSMVMAFRQSEVLKPILQG